MKSIKIEVGLKYTNSANKQLEVVEIQGGTCSTVYTRAKELAEDRKDSGYLNTYYISKSQISFLIKEGKYTNVHKQKAPAGTCWG